MKYTVSVMSNITQIQNIFYLITNESNFNLLLYTHTKDNNFVHSHCNWDFILKVRL